MEGVGIRVTLSRKSSSTDNHFGQARALVTVWSLCRCSPASVSLAHSLGNIAFEVGLYASEFTYSDSPKVEVVPAVRVADTDNWVEGFGDGLD